MPRGDYVLVRNPEMQPAVDFFTRTGNGPYVDTGIDIILRNRPGEPLRSERIYLSIDTIRQLAQVAGVTEVGSSADRDAQLIAQGKLDGLKEGLGGDLDRIAHTLRTWLDSASGLGDDPNAT